VERLVGKYFPYGQERPSATTDGKEKFATYFRDSETGLDYANQRYHQPGMGRFMTPDPLGAASSKNPSSWNQYAYTGGDPVNRVDPSGQDWFDLEIAGYPTDSCYGLAPFAWMNPFGYQQQCGDPGWWGGGSVFIGVLLAGGGGGGGGGGATPPPPPTCGDIVGSLSSSATTIVERLMNENSWGIVGDVPSVYTEDLWIMSAIYNRVSTPGFNHPRDSSNQPVADTVANQALYANGPGRPTSMTQGIALYNSALTSAYGSSRCDDLQYAINAMNAVVPNGTPVNSQVLSWFGVYGGNKPPGFYPAPLTQINQTQFFGFFNYPVTRPRPR